MGWTSIPSVKKKGYATTFCDLAKHNIFDVVPGKSSTDLSEYLKTLRGKERVKVVCIDLSTSYRNIVRQHFPNAMIVADRFHVIRLVNHMSMQTYQSIDPQIKYQRGILNALRTNPDNLNHIRCNGEINILDINPLSLLFMPLNKNYIDS